MIRYEKISERKQKLIDEFLSSPIQVGEIVVVDKGIIVPIYKNTNKTFDATVIEVLGEDIVCIDRKTADEYVQKYNKLAGLDECYVDEDVWIPLINV